MKMQFPDKLQKLRKEKGLSQEQLAELLGVSRQAISKWESGAAYPEMANLIALSEIFGVTIDSMIKDTDIRPSAGEEPRRVIYTHIRTEYEYRSTRTLFGLPLVHINIGYGVRRAKGIIAIGNIATGFLSMGFISCGLLSIGLLSAGIISLGVLSIALLLALGSVAAGVFALGAIAVGIFTMGAVSIGMFSIGALSIASHIAIGDHAYGHIAIGRVASGVKTILDTSSEHDFSGIAKSEVRALIQGEYPDLWGWIVSWATLLFR